MAEANQKVVVAGVPEHFNLPWHLALESGAFANIGIDLDFREAPGGTGQMMAGLEREEFDIAIVLAEGGVSAILNGNPSRLVKVFVESPLIWGIHVAADSAIEHVEQIRDQRYAISRFGSGSHLMAIVDAAERSWPTDNLQFDEIKDLDGARDALAEGSSDVFFWERFTTAPYVESSEFRRVGERLTLWPAFVVCVRKKFLDEHAKSVESILNIVNQSCADLMARPDAVGLISKRYELQFDEVKQWLSKTRWSTNFEKPVEAIQRIKTYLQRLDLVHGEAIEKIVWSQLGE